MLGYYPFTRKAVKWWKKVYFHLLSLALVNAHKVYVMQNIEPSNQSMPLSTFLKAVIRDLVGTRPRIQVEDVSLSHSSVSIKYFLEYTEATSIRSHAQLECKICSKKRRLTTTEGGSSEGSSRKMTVFRCRACKVPLCAVGCFEAYHTKENYWE